MLGTSKLEECVEGGIAPRSAKVRVSLESDLTEGFSINRKKTASGVLRRNKGIKRGRIKVIYGLFYLLLEKVRLAILERLLLFQQNRSFSVKED